MHSAKLKVKDMGSTAKEKLKEGSAKAQEKAETTTAHSKPEKQMAHEQAKAREAQAKADLHQEKAEHRADSAAHGTARVPLTGPRHNRHVGSVPMTGTTDPTYPTSGTHPASEKYL